MEYFLPSSSSSSFLYMLSSSASHFVPFGQRPKQQRRGYCLTSKTIENNLSTTNSVIDFTDTQDKQRTNTQGIVPTRTIPLPTMMILPRTNGPSHSNIDSNSSDDDQSKDNRQASRSIVGTTDEISCVCQLDAIMGFSYPDPMAEVDRTQMCKMERLFH